MRRWLWTLGLTAALLLGVPGLIPTARAQESLDELLELEEVSRQVIRDATPKTVLVRVTVNPADLPAGRQGGEEGERQGFGTGAIISADGQILTCSHVVDIASHIEVVLSDGTVLDAELLGHNRRQDYALLDVQATDLPHFELGDSTRVAVGDWVVALGHPGGPYGDLQPASSIGRVTGLHHRLPIQMMDRYYTDAVQTDVPIFAGNSGGPLVDLDGRLIGINGAILLINENSYAVPIDQIAADLDRLRAGEQIAGTPPGPEAFQELQRNFDPEDFQRLMERFMDNVGEGDGLSRIFEQLGEQFGNDELGDRLGRMMENPRMREMMRRMAENFFGGGDGEGGNPFEQLDELFGGGDRPNPFGGGGGRDRSEPPEPPAPDRPRARLGVQAEEVEGAVRLTRVEPGSAAAEAGLQEGDWITALDGTPVRSLSQVRRAIQARSPGDRIELSIARDEDRGAFLVRERLEVEVTLGGS